MVWPFSNSNSSGDSQTETQSNLARRSSERKSQSHYSPPVDSEPLKTLPQLPPDVIRENKKEDTQFLLEDTQPRFNNGPNAPPLPIKEAVSSIKADDFKFSNLAQIPCFREAGLTGLSVLGVLGTIIFITQKSPSKAANWGVGGFLLGSTVAWEQCRSKRRREMAFAAKARETVAAKEKPMLNKQGDKLTEENEKSREEVKSWWKR